KKASNKKDIGIILAIIGGILCVIMSVIILSDLSSDNDTSSDYNYTPRSTERDYYDKSDKRNTDRHYDDGEYREATKNARDAWDAQTK
ncbi:hypothetical protein, partial [uncultured Ruminococcus sp.]|uniref:hypothetical protein n=1 Tax=uncultured Ruminococcus sp. TaxID=165186 RepID=UPI0025E19F6B